MKDLIHGAVAEAREMVGEVVGEGQDDAQTLTDDQLLAQYETMRGDPWRVIQFTQERTGLRGREALREAARYEQAMEQLRKGRA